MARQVRDVALIYQVIASYDPYDPASQPQAVGDSTAELEGGIDGWRIAMLDDPYLEKADPEVLQAFQSACDLLADLGAKVSPVALPSMRKAAQANGLVVQAEAAAFYRQRLQENPASFGEDVRKRLESGAATSIQDYILARRSQVELRRNLELLLNDFDLLCLPATPVTAPLISGPDAVEQASLLTRFTAPFNLTGLPAIVLPCGFDHSGLPIGLQVVARPWAEIALLHAAWAYENATAWRTFRPVFQAD
jgi:aspartyl-tRNA(Asn)/glutamyl-tRNA(Gln) amidotransferase subunit A